MAIPCFLRRTLPRYLEDWKTEWNMLGIILVVILVLALFGPLPRWSHSREWGYAPIGGLGLVLCIVIILLVLGRI
ncbi:MAG TPA: DUF3309 domain-containing protein [Terriglobales bacterium]